MLSEGHTILVEDMKRTDGALFSSFVTLDKVTGRPQYTRHNPENGEIYIPKEICNVLLTPEDKEALRKGQPVFLENMINRKGEEFSSFVKLDMNTGRPQYSRTPDGFSERQVPVVPAEVYGHVFTAQERANLQDGKAILVSDLKKRQQQDIQFLPESERKFRTAAILPGKPGHTPQYSPACRTGGRHAKPAAGTEERKQTGRIKRIQKRIINHSSEKRHESE